MAGLCEGGNEPLGPLKAISVGLMPGGLCTSAKHDTKQQATGQNVQYHLQKRVPIISTAASKAVEKIDTAERRFHSMSKERLQPRRPKESKWTLSQVALNPPPHPNLLTTNREWANAFRRQAFTWTPQFTLSLMFQILEQMGAYLGDDPYLYKVARTIGTVLDTLITP
ncbi:hypothetical protein ANN_00619 [Periplaneta americana]|uniref:Uncharacterized protein n=1 Tax=Periplaneta americana TaxID=6978 RepID=A0ABQ8TU52_PERAM|nr:hypothetical protein ANN_00619 [Periplaneta americana]